MVRNTFLTPFRCEALISQLLQTLKDAGTSRSLVPFPTTFIMSTLMCQFGALQPTVISCCLFWRGVGISNTPSGLGPSEQKTSGSLAPDAAFQISNQSYFILLQDHQECPRNRTHLGLCFLGSCPELKTCMNYRII